MRSMIKHIKDHVDKKDLIGVEIGVYKGLNAKDILSSLSIKKMFLIDPYIDYIEEGIVWKVEYKKEFFNIAKKNLDVFKDKIQFIVKKSVDAINDIPDGIDFIYIDGSHKFKDVTKDIELYYPKLKPGGIIGGHDINSPSVFLAVILFAIKKKKRVYIKSKDWWIYGICKT